MNNELDNIQAIIEKVLSEKYPTFPKQIVFDILEIQKRNNNNPVEAQKEINAYRTNYFKKNTDVAF